MRSACPPLCGFVGHALTLSDDMNVRSRSTLKVYPSSDCPEANSPTSCFWRIFLKELVQRDILKLRVVCTSQEYVFLCLFTCL
jgi:hypothetical protein